MLQEGDIAPNFELPVDSEQTLRLSALCGAPVVVYFYPKDDTSGCTKEAIDFTQLRPEFDKLGVRVVGISPDSVNKHAKFAEKHKLTVTLAADEDKSVAEAYGVWAEKKMYGRTYMGIIRTTFLIDADGKIAKIWPKVKVTGHATAVLKTATELVNG